MARQMLLLPSRFPVKSWLSRVQPTVVLVQVAAGLLGLSVAWQWIGLRCELTALTDSSSTTLTQLAALALITAAMGPRLPIRLVLGLAARLGRRLGYRPHWPTGPLSSWILQLQGPRDETLRWLLLAVLASCMALAGLWCLLMLAVFESVHAGLMARFFWVPGSLWLMEGCGFLLVAGPLWLLQGLLLAMLTAMQVEQPRWSSASGVMTAALIGVAAACLFAESFLLARLSGTQILLLGVVPGFLLSVLATLGSNRSIRADQEPAPADDAPDIGGPASGWLRLALLAGSLGLAFLAYCISFCRLTSESAPDAAGWRLGGLLVMLAAGAILATRHRKAHRRSASGSGMAIVAAGVAIGLATQWMAYSQTAQAHPWLVLVIAGGPLGYALRYAELAWLARSGRGVRAVAGIVTTLPAGAGAGLLIADHLAAPALGPLGLLASSVLMMLACGGLCQIHETDRATHVQHHRLALVFAALALAVATLPAGVRHWQSHRVPMQTAPLAPLPAAWTDNTPLRSLCLLDVPLDQVGRLLPEGTFRVDVWPAAPRSAVPKVELNPEVIMEVHRLPGERSLRLSRARYDLVYRLGPPLESNAALQVYSLEYLRTLVSRLSSGGRLILDVPVTAQTSSMLHVVATTLEQATGSPCFWMPSMFDSTARIRLICRPGYNHPSAGPVRSCMAVQLPKDAVHYGAHSLRRDQLRKAYQRQENNLSDFPKN